MCATVVMSAVHNLRMRICVLLLAVALLLRAQPARDRHVVIISIDGLPAYALQDTSIPLPTLRKLAREGAVAEAMEVVNPAVTWPNHTSMVTGVVPAEHGVLYNGLAIRGAAGEPVTVEPWRNKAELVAMPTLYDVAHAAGLTTAEVDWVAILDAPTITWAFPERPRMTDTVVREMTAAGMITEADVQSFAKASIVYRDEVWTLAGQHIIEKHKPNLLLWHLLTTDSAQHRHGARSLAGNTALALADAKVQRLLDSLDRAGIRDRTTVFILSDHGFKTFKQVIHPNAALRSRGLLRVTSGKIEADVWVIPEGGTAMVYITRPERRAELLPILRTLFSGIAGVSQVLGNGDFGRLGLPTPDANKRMADLVLAAAEGYSFDAAHNGESVTPVPAGTTPGTHGYINTDSEMDAVFIVSGAGIRPGVKLGRVRNLDVAPTAAKLLGLEMRNIQGRLLGEVLK